jgi:phosphonatase-like hydrolase
MKKSIELIVFDIAGTTVRDNGEISLAFQKSLHEFGYNIPVADINPLMGYKKTEAIKKMLDKYEKQSEKITDHYINEIHEFFLNSMITYYSTTPDLVLLPFAEEIFSILKQKNIKIGLDTGFPKEITNVIMDRLGWLRDDKVDVVISSNEVMDGRPSPLMIEEIMKKTNVKDHKKVIKVGDTKVDVFEGKNAGCLYSIAITTGAFTRKELAEYNPSFIIDDLKELVSIIENIQ